MTRLAQLVRQAGQTFPRAGKSASLPQFPVMPLTAHTAIADYIANKKYQPEQNEYTPDDARLMEQLKQQMPPSKQRIVDAHRQGRKNVLMKNADVDYIPPRELFGLPAMPVDELVDPRSIKDTVLRAYAAADHVRKQAPGQAKAFLHELGYTNPADIKNIATQAYGTGRDVARRKLYRLLRLTGSGRLRSLSTSFLPRDRRIALIASLAAGIPAAGYGTYRLLRKPNEKEKPNGRQS